MKLWSKHPEEKNIVLQAAKSLRIESKKYLRDYVYQAWWSNLSVDYAAKEQEKEAAGEQQ